MVATRCAFLWLALTLASVVHASVLGQVFEPLSSSQVGTTMTGWSQTELAFWKGGIVTTKSGLTNPTASTIVSAKAFIANAKLHNAKALLNIGGFEGGVYFSNHLASSGNRKVFAKKVASLSKKLGTFDGVVLDWDAPGVQTVGCNEVRKTDSAHLKLFLTELREVLGSSKTIVVNVASTGLIGENGSAIKSGMKAFFEHVDYVVLQTADVYGEWSSTTGPNSPLRTCGSSDSIDKAVTFWEGAGLPKAKILLTVPTTATSFTTSSSTLKKTTHSGHSSYLYQSKSSTTPKGDSADTGASYTNVCGVKSTGYSGVFTYRELISSGKLNSAGDKGEGGWGYHWDSCTRTPFLFRPSTKNLISFENARSLESKAEYAYEKGLGGLVLSDSTGMPYALYKDVHAKLHNSKAKRHFESPLAGSH